LFSSCAKTEKFNNDINKKDRTESDIVHFMVIASG
jgi:hypothetical protein